MSVLCIGVGFFLSIFYTLKGIVHLMDATRVLNELASDSPMREPLLADELADPGLEQNEIKLLGFRVL